MPTILDALRRAPDLEAPNLHAVDAADRLLLDEAAPLLGAVAPGRAAVLGDHYGALTLGAAALHGATDLRVHTDRLSAEHALQANAARHALSDAFTLHALDADLLRDATVVLLQLPRGLDALDELAGAVARHADPSVTLLAGGRVKHMTPAMNDVLGRHFGQVRAGLGRQKSRVLTASGPAPRPDDWPRSRTHDDLGLVVRAHGAVFAGCDVDRGTRFLLGLLDQAAPDARSALDLGCGTGVLAVALARERPRLTVHATDESAAACASARATAAANEVTVQVERTLQPAPGVDLVVCNPPFHTGATVQPAVAHTLFVQAARVLNPGGELWTVYNSHLDHRPALRRLVGPTEQVGRNSTFTVCRSRRQA